MSDRVESCKEFVRIIVRCLTEWRAVGVFVRRIVRCLIELRAIRSLSGEL